MKKILSLCFAVILITANISFSQSANNIQTDYENLHSYIGKKTYFDFLEMYPKPSSVHINSGASGYVVYELDKDYFLLSFGQDKMLTNARISFKNKATSLNVLQEDIVLFSKIQSKKELEKALGIPNEIMINGSSERWMYQVSEKDKNQIIRIEFDNDKNVVIGFNFDSQLNNPQTDRIDASILRLLKEGETVSKDVKKALGLPSYCSINSQSKNYSERWLYESGNTQLTLHFDEQSTLQSFAYSEVNKK